MNSEAIRYFRCDCGGRTVRMQAKGRWVLTPRHHCSDPDETFVMIDSRAIAATPSLASQVPNVRQVVVELRRALMKALFGEIPIQGHLPVTIPGVAERGQGIMLGATSKPMTLPAGPGH